MRKVTILLGALFAVVICASAQKGEMSAGGSLGYGSKIKNAGIGGRFQYQITDQFRLAPDFMYFFENSGADEFDMDFNLHYLFPIVDKLKSYPVGGVVLVSGKNFGSDIKFGINVGGGVEYDITRNIVLNGELKYGIVNDFDQIVLSSGIIFKF